MFTPKEFEFNDREELVAFMRRYNFATIVSSIIDVPIATHLPFHILQRDGNVFLTAHFAKANKQWPGIEQKTAMVIFTQPHAYVSPTHYDKTESVPTWNYVAVHAYGNCTLIHDTDKGMEILEQMIMQSEPAYKAQWEALSEHYKMNMYNGIVPFEFEVTELKATAKLSQNKTEAERQRIIATLENSPESTERDIAEFMRNTRGH